jgi:hypothetical protein
MIGKDHVGAELAMVNLQGAFLGGANLQGAQLSGANLQGADLRWSNLQRAELAMANLQGAVLIKTNLQEADLEEATFDEQTTLPDGTHWTSDTDMTLFTNPGHPEFWRSDDPTSPAYRGDDANHEANHDEAD